MYIMIKRAIILCSLIVWALIPCRAQNQVVVTPAGEMERAVSGHGDRGTEDVGRL